MLAKTKLAEMMAKMSKIFNLLAKQRKYDKEVRDRQLQNEHADSGETRQVS